jgi:hypothetical protein
MSVASSYRPPSGPIWVYAVLDGYAYHLQYKDESVTVCGIDNYKPLKFAIEAYDEHDTQRCEECIFWYQQRVLDNAMTRKESQ